MMRMTIRYMLWVVGLFLVACQSPQSVTPAHLFTLPSPPTTMTREAQIDYLATHYWDRFPFTDSVALVKADTAAMTRHFSQFVALLSDKPHHRAPMDSLMARAAKSRFALDYFVSLADGVLHDPNSPLRSSELYIPVLEAQLAAPYYDLYERIYPEHALQMARKNRLGEPAADFRFQTRDGKESSLYALQAEHTLVLFSNPGCSMCGMLKELIMSNAVIVERITDSRLKVLVVYPDEDLKAWREAEGEPHGWIDACDAEGALRRDELYDLRAIPSIYLLDHQKRVVVKDSTDPREIEAALI